MGSLLWVLERRQVWRVCVIVCVGGSGKNVMHIFPVAFCRGRLPNTCLCFSAPGSPPPLPHRLPFDRCCCWGRICMMCSRLILVMGLDCVISMASPGITSSAVSFPIWPDDSTANWPAQNKNTSPTAKTEKNCTKKPVEGNSYIFTRTSAHWTHAATSNNLKKT